MIKQIEQVKQFYLMVGDIGYINSTPTHDPPRKDLKIRLIQEELDELKNSKDPVEAADALADLLYVVFGAVIEYGLSDRIGAIFDEVHRSNMSKGCKNVDEVVETIQRYKDQGVKTYGDALIVRRFGDGKILKSINYTPANIQPFILSEGNDPPSAQENVQEGEQQSASQWKTIETDHSPNGAFITQALQVAGGVLLRVKGYNKNKYCIGVENTYIPDLQIVEKLEKIEEGMIVTYSLQGIAV